MLSYLKAKNLCSSKTVVSYNYRNIPRTAVLTAQKRRSARPCLILRRRGPDSHFSPHLILTGTDGRPVLGPICAFPYLITLSTCLCPSYFHPQSAPPSQPQSFSKSPLLHQALVAVTTANSGSSKCSLQNSKSLFTTSVSNLGTVPKPIIPSCLGIASVML